MTSTRSVLGIQLAGTVAAAWLAVVTTQPDGVPTAPVLATSPTDGPLNAAYRQGGSVALPSAGRLALAARSWWGGRYTAPTGEAVTVYVSDSYPADPATGQRWANFLAGLVHGPELSLVTAYLAPLSEVEWYCGSQGVLGCYGNQRLVSIAEAVGGVSATEVVAHEYGHHVANNRVNPPWNTLGWGPKHWATAANVCARAAAGTAFPGDQGHNYRLNPGEAFAETYRVLNEARAGAATFSWPIVDGSFFPTAAATRAAEEDVARPWSAPATTVVGGRFRVRSTRTWSKVVQTPLDGDLVVTFRVPRGAIHEVDLVATDGRTILSRGLWSGATVKTLRYTVCGQRSATVRVARRGPPGPFTLEIARP